MSRVSLRARLLDALADGLEPLLEHARRGRRRREWDRNPAAQVSPAASIADSASLQFGPIGPGSIRIGRGARVSEGVILATFGGAIEIGEDVFLGPYCVVYGHGGVSVGSGTLVASHSSIAAVDHVFADPAVPIKDQGYTARGIRIGPDVWLGSGVRVVDGATIGRGAVVGAGAVVVGDVEEFGVAIGVPARVVRSRRGAS